MSRPVVPFVSWCVLIALSTAAVAAAESTSAGNCADLPYVENVYWTTEYGPAAADVVLKPANMVPCTGEYALCFYSGPSPLTCTVNEDGTSAACECYPLATTGEDEVYYVDINGILNTCVYIETVRACGLDGSGCQATNSAPVCGYIQDGTFAPGAALISTFSTVKAKDHGGLGACTDCASGPYVGCMTAPCTMSTDEDGEPVAVCECPLVTGPYQVGQDEVACDLADGQAWSASYNPAGCISIGPGGH